MKVCSCHRLPASSCCGSFHQVPVKSEPALMAFNSPGSACSSKRTAAKPHSKFRFASASKREVRKPHPVDPRPQTISKPELLDPFHNKPKRIFQQPQPYRITGLHMLLTTLNVLSPKRYVEVPAWGPPTLSQESLLLDRFHEQGRPTEPTSRLIHSHTHTHQGSGQVGGLSTSWWYIS